MGRTNKDPGCCGNVHAKNLEILLIIAFLLAIILLIINLALTLWQFIYSYYLLIIEIFIIVLNAFGLILSIILRVWRSNGSVFNKNFSSSKIVSLFIVVLVIINILFSITEEVLFSFFYFVYHIPDEKDQLFEEWRKNPANLDEIAEKMDKLNKKLVEYEKICIKLSNNHNVKENYGIPDNEDENAEKQRKKTFKILPWIAFNFNIFILILILICIIIIIKRINLKSDFNYLQVENNHSVQKKI